MKQVIILVATIALGVFIAGELGLFKDPVHKNINAAVTQMDQNITSSSSSK